MTFKAPSFLPLSLSPSLAIQADCESVTFMDFVSGFVLFLVYLNSTMCVIS